MVAAWSLRILRTLAKAPARGGRPSTHLRDQTSGTAEGAAVGGEIARGSQLRQQLDDLVFEMVCRLRIGRRIQLLGHD